MNGPGRHGGQGPDLLGHQHRVPQRDEEQAANRAVGPFRQHATEHGHVLHVPSRTGGVVVAKGQGVEAGPVGGLRLAEHRAAPPGGPGTVGGEGGADGYANSHHPKVYPTPKPPRGHDVDESVDTWRTRSFRLWTCSGSRRHERES